jgi:DNA-binding NarL/FixJ family response regulator
VQTLLIVDDNAAFRAIAGTVLASGFRVVGEAADARSAVVMARRLEPDVVLLDVELPDGTGFDVAAELSRDPGRPAIVLTSARSPHDFSGLDDRTVRGFVPKDLLCVDVLRALVCRA